MKLKEVDRTANVAWSPAAHHPIHLAAGTAAQQLDATFSTKAVVELYTLNLAESGQEMELAGSLEVDSRLYKLVWGSFGMDSDKQSGLLIGGAEHGKLSVWDPVKILGGSDDVLVHDLKKHTGQVIALDINPFQTNLLSSGDSESEIYIWDLNNPEKPMTPGSKPQQHAVNCVAWNRQVQHILGSSHGSSCVVWDLRKNEPIIKIRDSMSRIECNMICWHPDVATQLCIASEDDHAPVIQLWDLRCATSPVRLLENHQRGVVSMSWCPHDSDLLLSSGKDNRILCWNPNSDVRSGEVLYEVPTSNKWSFDVQWCPRIPGVISGSSFDGHISVYSIMGGKPPTQPPSKVAEAFPLDPFSQPVPQPTSQEPPETMLKKAPKWLRRPVTASFAFGGKLICVENPKPSHGQNQAPIVTISQVVTETDLVERSVLLEDTIASGQYQSFCDSKIKASLNKADRDLWSFLKANFTNDPRSFFLELLNYNQNCVRDKVAQCLATTKPACEGNASGGKDGTILGEDDEEEELAEITNKMTGLHAFANNADVGGSSPFDGIADPTAEKSSASSLPITVGPDCDGLITEALLVANFAAAVDVALHHNRMAEAMILAIAGGPDLLASTQSRVLKSIKSGSSQLLLSIVTRNFENIVATCELSKWKEALAIILTYVDGSEFTRLCNLLGSRLENEGNGEYVGSAQLCFIVAGNINQLVASWNKNLAINKSPQMLQDLVEKVMVLRKAVEASLGQREVTDEVFARVLTDYANLLAAQGCSLTALQYLGTSNESLIVILRDRLYHSLGQPPVNAKPPPRPFKVVDIQPERPHQPLQPTHAVQPRSRTSSANYTQPNALSYQPPVSQAKPSPAIGSYYPENINPVPVSQPYYTPSQPMNPGSVPYGFAAQPLSSAPLAPLAPSAAAKGPLSKYSSAVKPVAQPATIPPASGMFDPYQQPQQQASYPAEYTTQLRQPAGSQTPGAPLPPYVPPVTGSAWNDPPPVTGSTKKSSVDPPGAPSYEGLLYNPLEYEEQLRHQQKIMEEQHRQQHQQQQHQQSNQQQQQQPNSTSKLEPTMQAHEDLHNAVPPEHQVIQNVFDRLVELCQARAYSVPIKKKLEDVRRKLDALYEKLNSGMLSSATLTGLHQIVRAVQEYDYNAALAIVAQIVNVGSFTEFGVFMPGVKVLLQTAVQLQVFVQ